MSKLMTTKEKTVNIKISLSAKEFIEAEKSRLRRRLGRTPTHAEVVDELLKLRAGSRMEEMRAGEKKSVGTGR